MSDESNVAITKAMLEAFGKHDAEAFLEHCAEGFTFTVGDPVGQDLVPFFGTWIGWDQYREWHANSAEGPYQIVGCSTGECHAAEGRVFAAGEVTYLHKATNEEVKSTTMTYCRFVGDKVIEIRRWMEGSRFYRKQEETLAKG